MLRPVGPLAVVTLALLCMGQKPAAPAPAAAPASGFLFRATIGGLNGGTFSQLDIPQLTIMRQGDNVVVTSNVSAPDLRPILLSHGTVSGMALKLLADKIGEQMTVGIQIIPRNAKPGQRCSIELDHAYLKAVTDVALSLRPSENPKFECRPPPG